MYHSFSTPSSQCITPLAPCPPSVSLIYHNFLPMYHSFFTHPLNVSLIYHFIIPLLWYHSFITLSSPCITHLAPHPPSGCLVFDKAYTTCTQKMRGSHDESVFSPQAWWSWCRPQTPLGKSRWSMESPAPSRTSPWPSGSASTTLRRTSMTRYMVQPV